MNQTSAQNQSVASPIGLNPGPFINPFLLRALPFTGVVEEADCIRIAGLVLTSGTPLRIGERVRVWASQFSIELEYMADIEERQQARQWVADEMKRLEESRIARALDARRVASEQFYARQPVPFKFSIEVKERLSGLSASSNGDGFSRSTVYHIFTQQAVTIGRISRKEHDFLCSPAVANSAANWSGSLGNDNHRENTGFVRIPTCKRCLQLLQQLSKTTKAASYPL